MILNDLHFNVLQLVYEGEISADCALKTIEILSDELHTPVGVCNEEFGDLFYSFNNEIFKDFREHIDPDYDLIIKNLDIDFDIPFYSSIYDCPDCKPFDDSDPICKRRLFIDNFVDGRTEISNIPLANPTRRFFIDLGHENKYERNKIVYRTTNDDKFEAAQSLARSSTKDTFENDEFKSDLKGSVMSHKPYTPPQSVASNTDSIDKTNPVTPTNKSDSLKTRNWDKFIVSEKKPGFKSGLEYFSTCVKEGNAKPIPDVDLSKPSGSSFGGTAGAPSVGLPSPHNSYPRYNMGNYGNYKTTQGAGGKKDGPDIDPKYLPLVTGDVTPEIINMVLDMKVLECQKINRDDIVGLEDVKKVIIDKIVNPILMPGLHIGLFKAPKGILLFGPPGTGKTTIAKWIANVSNAAFFEISPSSITSKFYGESESIIKTLFKVALVESPSLIFIDEVDAILGKRKATDDESTVRMKNQLLQMMDGINSGSMSIDKESGEEKVVIIVGATNRPHMMDSAALRRFTKRILIPPPDHETRKKFIVDIINKRSSKKCIFSHEELERISVATEGWTGCDLLTLCYKAAEYCYDDTVELFGGIENIRSFNDFRGVEMKDIERALQCTRPSTDESMDFFIEWSMKHGSV